MTRSTPLILVTDPIGEEGLGLLREAGFDLAQGKGDDLASFADALGEASAWIVRSGTRVTADLIAKAGRLGVVGRAGTGLDNIDRDACAARGITVLNTPGANTLAAAELTVGLMLALARRIPEADASLRGGQWRRSELAGSELGGKTLGLVGCGRIGREVTARARAFGMRVLIHDPYVGEDAIRELGAETRGLDELLAEADYVSLHLPLEEATRGLMNAERIARMKAGARLINVARGGLLDEKALTGALKEGRLAGAAIDVWSQEPPGEHPLLALPQVVATPHLGASTAEAKQRVGLEICRLVRDHLAAGAQAPPAD